MNIDEWTKDQGPFEQLPLCGMQSCVHDGEFPAGPQAPDIRMCRMHYQTWKMHRRGTGTWDEWYRNEITSDSVRSYDSRGTVRLASLPKRLQQEIRYGLHRHARSPGRVVWAPTALQHVVDVLTAAGINSLHDDTLLSIAQSFGRNDRARPILDELCVAARGLTVTADDARAEGWFDPLLVGAAPFPSSEGGLRRRAWDLTSVSQRWLRDLLWDFLKDESLRPAGRRICAATVSQAIFGTYLLSYALRQVRDDHGNNASRLGKRDAHAVKEAWDLWTAHGVPIPRHSVHQWRGDIMLTERTRFNYALSAKIVLRRSRERGLAPAVLDTFILDFPTYPKLALSPRPRPLSAGDFRMMVGADALAQLAAADQHDVGYCEIWLSHAFQGGRIGETLKLRLGCIGLIGSAQPYLWRDISKLGIVDYGMPCHLPVYERLLARREKTLAKLRTRYASELGKLDAAGRARLEASWDRHMPLFPRLSRNPDLTLEVGQGTFRTVFATWVDNLGLASVTTHRTRATLATSLLNNGAPPALVRQVLGHFSEESLAHYARYNSDSLTKHLRQVWAAGPGMDKPGTILLTPAHLKVDDPAAASSRIDLASVPVEHGLCRYGPVVGGAQCPKQKNCTTGPTGACEHFALSGMDLLYWERKRDAAYHFAEGAPTPKARDYILSAWQPWDHALAGLRDALAELGLLEAAQKVDLRTPLHDYFDPLFATAWPMTDLVGDDNASVPVPRAAAVAMFEPVTPTGDRDVDFG